MAKPHPPVLASQEKVSNSLKNPHKEIAREEQRLARAGSSFASQREILKAEQLQLQRAIKESDAGLRELAE